MKEDNDHSLFTVSRYIPDDDFTKVVEKKKKKKTEQKKEKEKTNDIDKSINKMTEEDFAYINNFDTIDEQAWFNNLIQKTDQHDPSENSYDSESDENIIVNSDNIFKNIYPFFKTEEDPNYLKEKKELKKFITRSRIN
ncbi:conserved Plasmodium protein, unknown function [Plasmodium chabaudi adami]|uniref:Uncharacterized protein n=1 Tax=Plasmodium chabaudi adami TaxID=5826 RepID=A0A1D3S1B4_PLACE|nr:conserved Plasmodium protein, unknown function [Plasmodium chabaudi adami]